MVLYPNKLPESERVCSGICNQKTMIEFFIHMPFQEFLIRGKSIKHIETFMIFVFL